MLELNRIHLGDNRQTLKSLPSESVHTCVTSPPYFGLRDYGMQEQIGLEPTPEAFVQELVELFREVRRVLRNDGTLWLNLGDTYAMSTRGSSDNAGKSQGRNVGSYLNNRKAQIPNRLKPKDLIGIPWRVAFALQADGWYLRQDIIWHKPNPMPESVKDRCTKSHEYIFLLSKSSKYYYDAKAIEEPAKWERWGNQTERKSHKGTAGHLGGKTLAELPIRDKKNKRSVWQVSTKPFKGAHFATFPPDLIEPCVLAGCPEDGVVLDCFMGAGTTALVAKRNGRNYIGCELNPEYKAIAEERVANSLPKAEQENQLDLFKEE
jgi:DNA modification methylase